MDNSENKYASRTSYDRYSKSDYDEADKMLLSVENDADNAASLSPRVVNNRRYLEQLHEQARRDPRFQPPSASRSQRAALLVFVAFLFWLALYMRRDILNVILDVGMKAELKKMQAEEADWYSDEYRFRPAASPIVTETLADGHVRLHGAQRTVL